MGLCVSLFNFFFVFVFGFGFGRCGICGVSDERFALSGGLDRRGICGVSDERFALGTRAFRFFFFDSRGGFYDFFRIKDDRFEDVIRFGDLRAADSLFHFDDGRFLNNFSAAGFEDGFD